MIRFYTDHNVHARIAVQLRQRGIEVVRCEEVSMEDAEDSEHLTYAVENQLTVITFDDDFTKLHHEFMKNGQTHFGIFYCLNHLQGEAGIGVVVKFCADYHALIEAGAGTVENDLQNTLIHIS